MTTQKIEVTLKVNPATQPNPLVVEDAEGNVVLDGGNLFLADETVGVADNQVVANLSGGTKPYSASLSGGSLPDGIQLVDSSAAQDGSQLSLEGTPTTAGEDDFELTVGDASGQTAKLAARRKIQ